MASSIKVKMSPGLLKQVHRAPEEILKDLAPVVRDHAQLVMAEAQVSVPRESGALANSAGVDGPVHHPDKKSVLATAYYAHPAAGAIHEGFHYGLKTERPEPRWFRKAARRDRSRFRKAVAQHIAQTLSRVFAK